MPITDSHFGDFKLLAIARLWFLMSDGMRVGWVSAFDDALLASTLADDAKYTKLERELGAHGTQVLGAALASPKMRRVLPFYRSFICYARAEQARRDALKEQRA